MNKSNQYAFKVDKDATKLQIKRAVEKFFSVNVREVQYSSQQKEKRNVLVTVSGKNQIGKKLISALLKVNQ